MKTILFIFFVGILFFTSCLKNDHPIGIIKTSNIQNEIWINSGDTLKINLGNFGEEEGASIYKHPANAKKSIMYREIHSSSIIYKYYPNDNFSGRDSIIFILNKGSDGASFGINDTTHICIIVKQK